MLHAEGIWIPAPTAGIIVQHGYNSADPWDNPKKFFCVTEIRGCLQNIWGRIPACKMAKTSGQTHLYLEYPHFLGGSAEPLTNWDAHPSTGVPSQTRKGTLLWPAWVLTANGHSSICDRNCICMFMSRNLDRVRPYLDHALLWWFFVKTHGWPTRKSMEEQLDAGALYVINPHCFLIAVVNPMTLISPRRSMFF